MESDLEEDIELAAITTEGVQTRAEIRDAVVDDYVAELGEGTRFPRAIVYRDEAGVNWLAAGHHRYAAHKRAALPTMACWVRYGSRFQAILGGLEDNNKHKAERLTREDRKHGAELILKEHPEWKNREIGRAAGIDHKTVAAYRASLERAGTIPKQQPLNSPEEVAGAPASSVTVTQEEQEDFLTPAPITKLAEPHTEPQMHTMPSETNVAIETPQQAPEESTIQLLNRALDALGGFNRALNPLKARDNEKFKRLRRAVLYADKTIADWRRAVENEPLAC